MSVQKAQEMLRDAGFDPGRIDGVFGDRSLSALAEALRRAAPAGAKPAPVPALRPLLDINALAIRPAMSLLQPRMDSIEARVLLLAISGQEADFHHRWQVFDRKRPDAMGAARGLWQFERGGGVRGVLTHERTRTMAADVCRMRNVPPTVDAVYSALHRDDILAAAFARLLLWSSPAALPKVGDVDGAWKAYLREWRPGAYTNGSTAQREALRAKWGGYYARAVAALAAT